MPHHSIFAPTFHGNVAAVKKLLKDDPTLVAVRDAKNLTPLHVAARRGQSVTHRVEEPWVGRAPTPRAFRGVQATLGDP